MKKILLSFVALSVLLPAVSLASIDTNLSYGSRGSAVVELQQFLITKGLLNTEATGNFFGLTKSAVISYQNSKGLPATGFVGPLTRAEISTDLKTVSVSTSTVPGCTSTTLYSPTTGKLCSNTNPGVSVSATPVAPTVVDLCKNIDGVQATVPTGMSVDTNANCSLPVQLPVVSLTATGAVVPTTTPSISAQFVASLTGAVDAAKTTFNLNMINGSGTITELTFSFSGTPGVVSSVRVGSVSAPVINDVAYLTGLSIPVPNSGSGVNVEVWTSYVSVGINGVPSGSTSTLRLTKIKYLNGSGSQSITGLAVDGPQMTLVGSKPTVNLTLPNGASGSSASGLNIGQKYVADINIKADANGDIKINTIPLTFNGSTADTKVTITDATDLVIKNAGGTVVSNYTVGSIVGSGTSVASAKVTFTDGYRIAGGQTETFKIEANISAVSGSGASLAVGINPGASFTWTDLAGNGVAGARDGSSGVMPSYPTTTVSLRN